MAYHPGLMMRIAKDFVTAADDCMRPAGENQAGGNQADSLRVVPAIINAAFAAEVSIKSGYVLSKQKPPKGHDLSVLFANLPNDLRDRIKARLRQNLTVTDQAFDGGLQKIADAFVDWRYVYETDQIDALDYKFLSEFALACYNTIIELGNAAQVPAHGPQVGVA